MKRSQLELRLADGTVVKSCVSYELHERFSDPLDTFRATIVPAPEQRAMALDKLQKGELAVVAVDGHVQGAFMIQTRRTTVSPRNGVVIDIDCVSPIRLLAETTVDAPVVSKILSSDRPVLDFVASIVEPFGFTEVQDTGDVAFIKAKTGVNPKSVATAGNNAKQKDCRADYNETNLAFINRVLSRLGVMLRCGASDNGLALYITAPHYDGKALYTVRQAPADKGPEGDPFFGDVTITETNEDQFSKCSVFGTTSDEDASTRANEPKGSALTTDINATRPPFRASFTFPRKEVFYKDDNTTNAQRANAVATHVLGRRAERAFAVSGTVQGLVSSGGVPWTVDTLCRVYVHATGLDEVMWISERTMRQDAQGGQSTMLTLIPKGYFVLGEIGSN